MSVLFFSGYQDSYQIHALFHHIINTHSGYFQDAYTPYLSPITFGIQSKIAGYIRIYSKLIQKIIRHRYRAETPLIATKEGLSKQVDDKIVISYQLLVIF